MFRNMNYKQRIWVCTILFLIVFSFIFFTILFINEKMIKDSGNYDIWGSNSDLIIGIFFIFPYFLSLTVLLHSGYMCFKSTLFLGYRCWHYIAIVLSLLTILAFWALIIYYKVISSFVPLIIIEKIFAIILLISFIDLALDFIGTKSFNRHIKDILSEKI